MTDEIVKVAYTVPLSRELLDAAGVDFYNMPIHPRSPLERARERIAEAEGELEAAEDALDAARAEYERLKVIPGSDDITGEPRTLNQMLADACRPETPTPHEGPE